MGVVRLLLAVFLAGCGFRHGEQLGAAAGDAMRPLDAALDALGDASPDVSTAPPPFCDANDLALVACYDLDGTVADGSPHHLDPDVMTNVSFGAGKVGQALVVSKTTEVDVADNALFDVSALTIEAWIDLTALPVTGDRAGILDCDQQYGFFVYPGGDIQCSIGVTVTAAITAGQWIHVACTHDGAGTGKLYINGAPMATAPVGALSTGGTTGITIGGNNPPGGGNPLDGSLDQLRLFSAARTDAQICADAGRLSCN
jgi:hypothetical protein